MTDFGPGIEFRVPLRAHYEQILTPEAVAFAVSLQRTFNGRRKQLLEDRTERQARLDGGEIPDFLAETKSIRDADWSVAQLPADLLDRRVEITGPVDRKMVINALNSGAKVFMADFEDSTTPTWNNLIEGQINLRDAVRRTISFTDSSSGKQYELVDKPAVLFVRPRGWHLEEQHLFVDGEAMSGSMFDFAFYCFHNAKELVMRRSGPYFYLPKLENHLEARLWNDIFIRTEADLGLPVGSVRSTVLIETILATFEMDEILYELCDHSAGLNCGRWDYIFSFIKKFATDEKMILPDRSQIGMTTHFMRSYSLLCIETCHRRRVSAMGGMSALIPIKNNPEANETAMAGVRADKERQATDGHDGTWVAHPGLVPIAMEIFNRIMPEANQIERRIPGYKPVAADLLQVPTGTVTEAGLKQNVAVGLGYMEAWLRGIGCVPLFNLMEDAATAEISRAQLWQWVHHGAELTDHRRVTPELCDDYINAELAVAATKFDSTRMQTYQQAATLLRELVQSPGFPAFLTIPAYASIMATEGRVATNRFQTSIGSWIQSR